LLPKPGRLSGLKHLDKSPVILLGSPAGTDAIGSKILRCQIYCWPLANGSGSALFLCKSLYCRIGRRDLQAAVPYFFGHPASLCNSQLRSCVFNSLSDEMFLKVGTNHDCIEHP
jgi:hypothetical protein